MRRARLGSVAAAAAALLVAVPAHADPGDPGVQASQAPLRAPTAAEVVATRQRFFGRQNVNPANGEIRRDRLILSWFGVTNFAMAIRGHVVLLDAWVPRGAHSGYVPTSPQELALLRPSRIFIGHAHFDHAGDAVPIAQASGATLVGSAEQCEELRGRVTGGPQLECIEALGAGASAGTQGDAAALRGVEVKAVKNVHSGPTPPDGYHVPALPPPSTTTLEHPPTPQDMLQLFARIPDAEAGSVLWRFRAGGFSFVWHDSSGPLDDLAPYAFEALRSLRPVDLQLGAIQSFNQFTNGMRDFRRYVEMLQPATFVPSHHDDWAFPLTTRAHVYRPYMDAELQKIPYERRPAVRFIADPGDYVRPEALTFRIEPEDFRLGLRCTRGRLRLSVRREVAGVQNVRFRAGRRRAGDSSTPYARSFARRSVGRGRISATVRLIDGTSHVLRRARPACLRRSR